MKILHYLLGLPPVRTGGLVKYALDLAEAESISNEVTLLIPGSIVIKKKNRGKVSIQRSGHWKKIPIYKIKNPLPIPMGNGIVDIDEFTLPCNGEVYSNFLKKISPDIVHMHTLMGIHAQFLLETVALNIPTVFTTHDYFGICPTVHLFYRDNVCFAPYECCGECSRSAFSEKRLLLEQSNLYKIYRKNRFMIWLLQTGVLKKCMKSIRSNTVEQRLYKEFDNSKEEYQRLRCYYQEMFNHITYFHFNSDISRRVYEQSLGHLSGKVIYISNNSVKDRRRIRQANGKLKIGFLGGDKPFKGLSHLQKVLNELYVNGMDQIELQIYGSFVKTPYPFCKYYDSFGEEERDAVFERMDILAVPSRWMETFGMVVLEALSYGVPVVVSDKVGAQGLLNQDEKPLGVILQDNTTKAWEACIAELYQHREKIQFFNENIVSAPLTLEYSLHVEKIIHLYEECLATVKLQ